MDPKREVLGINVKKIVPWGTGLALFITKEARALEWPNKDHVVISAFRDKEGDGIEIRRAPIKRQR